MAWDGHSWDICFAALAEMGAVKVELAYIDGYVDFTEHDLSIANASHLRRKLSDYGLTPGAVSAHTDLGAVDAREKLERRIRFAAELGSIILVTNAAQVESASRFWETLDYALPIAEAEGVTIALENPGHGENALIGSGSEGSALVSGINSPWLRLNYDVANAVTYSGGTIDWAADFEVALPWVAQVHVKDFDTSKKDWSYPALNEGELDVAMFADLVYCFRSPPAVTLELPLRLCRRGGGPPTRADFPIAAPKVRENVRRSLNSWMEAALSSLARSSDNLTH